MLLFSYRLHRRRTLDYSSPAIVKQVICLTTAGLEHIHTLGTRTFMNTYTGELMLPDGRRFVTQEGTIIDSKIGYSSDLWPLVVSVTLQFEAGRQGYTPGFGHEPSDADNIAQIKEIIRVCGVDAWEEIKDTEVLALYVAPFSIFRSIIVGLASPNKQLVFAPYLLGRVLITS